MPNLTLETLPSEVILRTLHSFDSFKDVNTLINSSAICYRLFNFHSNSILTHVSKNMLKRGWKAATTVLVYQRHSGKTLPDYFSLMKDLETEFTLQKKDIPRLIANQRCFNSCAVTFEKLITVRDKCRAMSALTRAEAGGEHSGSLAFTPSPFNPHERYRIMPPTHIFSRNFLSVRLFYETWVLSLRLEYDTLRNFARRKPLSTRQVLNFRGVSSLMLYDCECRKIIGVHDDRSQVYKSFISDETLQLLELLTKASSFHEKYNPLLRVKTLFHIKEKLSRFGRGDLEIYFRNFLPKLLCEWQEGGFEYMVAEYGLAARPWEA